MEGGRAPGVGETCWGIGRRGWLWRWKEAREQVRRNLVEVVNVQTSAMVEGGVCEWLLGDDWSETGIGNQWD